MKKISVVARQSLRTETVATLRDIGVLHVVPLQESSETIDSLREERGLIERSVALLALVGEQYTRSGGSSDGIIETVSPAAVVSSPADKESVILDSRKIAALADQRGAALEQIERLSRQISALEPWGETDTAHVAGLAKAGISCRLYQLSPDRAAELDAPNTIELYRDRSIVRIVSIALPGDVFPDLPEPFPFPEESLSQLVAKRDGLNETVRTLSEEILAFNSRKNVFEAVLSLLDDEIEFAGVERRLEADEKLCWLTGFVPTEMVSRVQTEAKTHGWGILVRDPDIDDAVPTQVRNPKAIRIIQPVFDLLGTVPGYRELDTSFWFLIFFTLFFAMIIGDGGYGAILLFGSIRAAVKSRKAESGIGGGLILFLVLSFATVIWGALTGNWFGYAPFAELPVLRLFVIEPLAASNPASTMNIQWLCFVIGTVHLSIAHTWKLLRGFTQRPRVRALTDLGMLSMVLGLYFLVLQLVLDSQRFPMPSVALKMIVGGFLAVVLFSNQEEGRNFFVGAAKGLSGIITIALDSISAFSDIISYIRLFAVGLASLAIAQSFNGMAIGINESIGGIGGPVAAAVVLFLGHTLNLAMGALSVIVHGVRLNMLEFSGHLGMEWTGVAYAPFQKRNSA